MLPLTVLQSTQAAPAVPQAAKVVAPALLQVVPLTQPVQQAPEMQTPPEQVVPLLALVVPQLPLQVAIWQVPAEQVVQLPPPLPQ